MSRIRASSARPLHPGNRPAFRPVAAAAPSRPAHPGAAWDPESAGADRESPVGARTCGTRSRSWRCRRKWHPGRAEHLAVALALALAGCAGWPSHRGLHIVTAPAPSADERYCAWYAAAQGDVLYVGESAFWSAMRGAGGDPRADLAHPGPRPIGRFDLRRERWLAPLSVGPPDSPSGVWDVHPAHGQVYFTTFFGDAGRVDATGGEPVLFPDAGRALNELADGPDGRVLASRYGSGLEAEGDGELLTLEPDGEVAERFHLPAPDGYRVAPKTPAWDPARGQLWATTDLFPLVAGEIRHDAYRVDRVGGAVLRSARPELQFVTVDASGRLLRIEADAELWLHSDPPPDAPLPSLRVLLEREFPRELDFVQDVKTAPDGRIVVTRWSGRVHVVDPAGDVRTLDLPRLDPEGLYYTGVLRGDRLCVTHCADVTVVCTDAP